MQVKPRSYPHPVLSGFSDDIVGAQFQSTVGVKGTKTSYVLEITSKTSDRDLAALIAKGKARYAVHVECPSTRYRSLFADCAERFRFEIPSSAIDGRVEISSFILASTDLPAYENNGFNVDYHGLSFVVWKGDTLAVGADATFIAEKKTDPLRQIPSMFVVVQNEADDAPAIDIDASGHKVVIRLSRENYISYRFLKSAQHLITSLNSMIIVPALITILEDVKRATGPEATATLESRRWYSVLARRLKEIGVDAADAESFTDSSLTLAHRLIGEPLTHGLTTLRSYEENDD